MEIKHFSFYYVKPSSLKPKEYPGHPWMYFDFYLLVSPKSTMLAKFKPVAYR